MSLNDIDAQLAELKARLGGLDSEASDDESGGGAREESRDNDPKRKSKKEKKSKKSKKERKEKKAKRARSSSSESASDGGEDSDSELAPIAPLPASCLPEHNAYAAKSVGKRRKQSKAGSPATATAAAAAWARGDGTVDAADASRAGASDASPSAQRPAILNLLEKRREKRAEHRCDVCDKDFTSQAQLEEHRRGKAHRSRATSHGAGGAGRGGRGGARGGGGPVRPAPGPRPPPGVPHCALCRKAFTSQAQLEEHRGGKWHKARASGELPPSRKPYNAT